MSFSSIKQLIPAGVFETACFEVEFLTKLKFEAEERPTSFCPAIRECLFDCAGVANWFSCLCEDKNDIGWNVT